MIVRTLEPCALSLSCSTTSLATRPPRMTRPISAVSAGICHCCAGISDQGLFALFVIRAACGKRVSLYLCISESPCLLVSVSPRLCVSSPTLHSAAPEQKPVVQRSGSGSYGQLFEVSPLCGVQGTVIARSLSPAWDSAEGSASASFCRSVFGRMWRRRVHHTMLPCSLVSAVSASQ